VHLSPNRKIFAPKGRILLEHVDELIDPHMGESDEQLLRENKWSVDVNNILSMQLNQNGIEDF
jgi:hypothetical protein